MHHPRLVLERGGFLAHDEAGVVQLVERGRADRGFVRDLDINRAQSNYGYSNGYTPYANDYSQYGYRRY